MVRVSRYLSMLNPKKNKKTSGISGSGPSRAREGCQAVRRHKGEEREKCGWAEKTRSIHSTNASLVDNEGDPEKTRASAGANASPVDNEGNPTGSGEEPENGGSLCKGLG
ncbi:hypothetical protein PGT21_002386 [Puccinia graminis f. sp. tritici]|uniref:Uncharacterized protein n=1 Tax=Puccinia graminis f. sp. tritici TaxID=56615 RepID=A0A5B0R1A0_PUCGR|nr:hypothetical protein PGT21_002386 [Puccinia graminis f. sp. tritici]